VYQRAVGGEPRRWRSGAGTGSLVRLMSRSVSPFAPQSVSIDRSCRRVSALGAGVVLAAAAGGWAAWPGASAAMALAALALALATWLVVAGTLWRSRRLLPPEATGLGVATLLTLLRGLLVSLTAAFAAVPASAAVLRWLPAVFYGAAVICDRFDGVLARRLGQTTALGARLDEAMDALGLLVAPAVAVSWGRLPPWYLLVGGAYYLYRAGLWLRRRLALPVYIERVRPKRSTRIFAGLQMTLVAAALAPLASPHVTAVAATLLMGPTLAFFARDWFIVIGRRAPPAVPAVGAP
jgi:CDP-diacylglycerol--glycerol-3-phosphate 3-phosphatidyltransferase